MAEQAKIQLLRGTLSSILASQVDAGKPAVATDTNEILVGVGVNWKLVGAPQIGLLANRPSPTVLAGRLYYATDTEELFLSHNDIWTLLNPSMEWGTF